MIRTNYEALELGTEFLKVTKINLVHPRTKNYTGRLIMFFVFTNIYNKKTKGPTLMELLTATGKLKQFFLTTIYVRRVHHGDTAHIDTIFKFLPHTCVNMGAFCLHRHPVSVNCLYHAQMVLSVGGSFAYCARNARCTVTTDLLV